ncbi:hypothetical protein CLAFUW4_12891 [Fulvia fulva]|uniref:Uncharacterized protein n=1 Tax=Passalora fulva TaxID=5499 RepID=A0A9Q8UVH3_PASFU|nr:uncharacterized protein CLAFUR5_12757 [Fulvia fulva]KAK4611619.1 hypothetical protein CLAFUR4_12895 [Fulvia fulva]KAK4613137.1 hypothetical protein CLAFUR0_12901 [Fulvia fulva]UJO23963.1 hypothetical protein CLAFUR5_12757 [Fulvia fulva]WPV20976.1 hypothetical protein CLAFUW4_12891 [Fulvia fulva]WPV36532.1 hypothetical protein CLAFUW7_12898 [Fulvia fulva]
MSTVPPLDSHILPFWAVYQNTWQPSTPPPAVATDDPRRRNYYYLPQAAIHIHDLATGTQTTSSDRRANFVPIYGPNNQVIGTGLQFVGEDGVVHAFWITRVTASASGVETKEVARCEVVQDALREGEGEDSREMVEMMGSKRMGEAKRVAFFFGESTVVTPPGIPNNGFGVGTSTTTGQNNTPQGPDRGHQPGHAVGTTPHSGGYITTASPWTTPVGQQAASSGQPGPGHTGTPSEQPCSTTTSSPGSTSLPNM